MPRTIVYPPLRKSDTYAHMDADDSTTPDDYGKRLLKYVPAEVIGFYLLASAFPDSDALQMLFLFVAAIATPAYLWYVAPDDHPPLAYSYVLATLAFLAWALGTSPNAAGLLNLGKGIGPAIMLVGAFLVPLVDGGITKFLRTRRAERR